MIAKRVISRQLARGIQDAHDEVMRDHKEAMRSCDLDDLATRHQYLCQVIREWHDSLWEALFGDESIAIEAEGALFLRGCDMPRETGEILLSAIDRMAAAGYEMTGRPVVVRGMKESADLAASFRAKWPFVTDEMIETGRTAVAAGRVVDVESLLHGKSS